MRQPSVVSPLTLGALALGIAVGWLLHPGPAPTLGETVNALTGRSPATGWNLLPTVWDTVHREYVDAGIDDTALLDGLLAGLVRGLNDPYSAYLKPSEAEELGQELNGRLEGIGAEIGIRDERAVVIAPLPGSPAERAGVRAGDRILSVDGTDTVGRTLDQVVSAIRGPAGSTVELVLQAGDAAARTLRIERAEVKVDSVQLAREPGAEGRGPIAVVTLRSFTPDTHADLIRALTPELAQRPSGVVLDLRGNPGGYLDSAIAVLGEFLRDGVAVIEAGRDGARTEHRVDGKPLLPDVPLVVLVDGGSASAAEIVAGALQDAGRARVLGETTFGKGSVQTLERLPNGGELRLTVARWLTPKGRTIDHTGIEPDRTVEPGEEGTDPVFAAALAELRD